MMAHYWRKKRNANAAEVLSWRARGIRDGGTLTRLNTKVLRGILLEDHRDFCKVWSKTSKSTILYENGKIYLENYLKCYSCVHSEPHALYDLPKRSKVDKFEDTLLCQSPLETTLASASDHKSSLLFLTANNWLYRLSESTGQELERVFLSSKHTFRYLSWDVSQEIFYVKSVQNKGTSLSRQADITQNTVMHLIIFQVFPLQIVGMMEVNKQVFGNGIIDVDLSQGVLAVSYSRKAMKLFSFEHIVQKYLVEKLTLGKPSLLLSGKTVGDVPFGIPVNIHITDCPPVLFEVSCSSNGVQIGGFPWHYIHTPPQKCHQGTHHFRSLKDGTMAINGIQNMSCYSLESDAIFFHPDDSGRIIHAGPRTINILKILGELNGGLPCKSTSQVTVTSSGRTVKRRWQQLDDDPDQETFRTVIYEDELDLLAVVVTNGAEGEGKAQVRLHDNQSGQLLKTVELLEPWDETYRHDLIFDKDTIVHIEQKNTNVCCHIYKLKTATKQDQRLEPFTVFPGQDLLPRYESTMENYKQFLVTLSSAGVVGVIAIIFVLRWVLYYQRGLAWDGGLAEFNWHPVLNVCGFIILQGLAIIVYRLPWSWKYSKLTMKFIHASLNLVAFIFAVVATVAVFDYHNAAKIPNMYSLHSWVGLAAVILYCLQLVLGVSLYLLPFAPVSWRAALMPVHVYSGLFIFTSVIAAALMGITEKLIFALTNPKYKDSPPEAIFVNVLGLLLVLFGGLILWIATRQSWKRPSDQTLHTLHSNGGGEDDTKAGPALSQLSDGAEGGGFGEVRRRNNAFDDQVN